MTGDQPYDFSTKEELLEKLRSYAYTPDDDNIRYKKKIEDALLGCPELLYALNNPDLENELFNEDGSLNVDGEWDRYFGKDSNIRPYLYIPQTQNVVQHFICYQTYFDSAPRYNSKEKYGEIKFTIMVDGRDPIDTLTGLARHDLIASIIRERFNWSNIFGTQCSITEVNEGLTDSHYLLRTVIIQLTTLKDIVNTSNGKTSTYNYMFRR